MVRIKYHCLSTASTAADFSSAFKSVGELLLEKSQVNIMDERRKSYFPAKQISLLKDIFSMFFLQMPHERSVPLENILTLRHSEVSIKNAAKPSRTPILKKNKHFIKNSCT